MKLSISNIAWNRNELEFYLNLLQKLKCDGVEISPSCIWDEPTEIADTDIESIKKLILKYNLEISAFHTLLYNKPNLFLFKNKTSRNKTISYLKKLIKLASKMSVEILVYGSAPSRQIMNKPYKECYNIAVDTFGKLAKECRLHDICLCIEPLESAKNDFIQNSDEGYKLVKDVDDPGFKLHLDAGAMSNGKENFNTAFKKCKTILKHFHVNDPGLSPPGTKNIDHSIIAKSLISSGYNGFISIEMRRNSRNNLEIITKAIQYTQEKYLINS